ncbi:hypothetical protein CH063_12827 [Colletotrichum higginsianum]|uniref:Uncharacterized protein n=1 Tax=Colletotrichum higginsianum (strain IMI 349063) TaxID=759273 RepID=H1VRX7_COLHI|nr:hypothetical protein CH063_12827 [Colletotrichum higginsianum]
MTVRASATLRDLQWILSGFTLDAQQKSHIVPWTTAPQFVGWAQWRATRGKEAKLEDGIA